MDEAPQDGETPTRAGYVALIGAPNAGKSTLVNALTGAKVSIVTHKVQTTRSLVRGIVIHDVSQIILVDTPGIFHPKRALERAMVRTAWGGAQDADLIVLLVDARKGLTDDNRSLLEKLADVDRPRALILNKIDTVPREKLLELTKECNEACSFDQTFMISALKGYGVADLVAYLAKQVPPGPWLYPEDQISDLPMRMLAAEITREKLMLRLHQELPYQLTVETEQWKNLRGGGARIEQIIYVGRESQRPIVLGHKGQTIKDVGASARIELSELMGAPVHLFLHVKVDKDWERKPERYMAMGLEFSDSRLSDLD